MLDNRSYNGPYGLDRHTIKFLNKNVCFSDVSGIWLSKIWSVTVLCKNFPTNFQVQEIHPDSGADFCGLSSIGICHLHPEAQAHQADQEVLWI